MYNILFLISYPLCIYNSTYTCMYKWWCEEIQIKFTLHCYIHIHVYYIYIYVRTIYIYNIHVYIIYTCTYVLYMLCIIIHTSPPLPAAVRDGQCVPRRLHMHETTSQLQPQATCALHSTQTRATLQESCLPSAAPGNVHTHTVSYRYYYNYIIFPRSERQFYYYYLIHSFILFHLF